MRDFQRLPNSIHVMPDSLIIRIGNISIAIESDVQEVGLTIAPVYRPFVSGGKTDMTLRLRRGAIDTRSAKRIFDCPPIWTLHRRGETSLITLFPNMAEITRTLVIPPAFQKAELYFSNPSDFLLDPFFGPGIELLIVNYLAQGRGVILHACGIARNGRGILFVGESGAGKSTLANLWHSEAGVDIFSDDRIIVRKQGDALWMYGTPWHGSARFGSPRRARIEQIFFLRHGRENSLALVKASEAAAKLLVCSFPPHWDAAGMRYTLNLLNELVTRRPCREFSFRADGSVVEFISGLSNED